MRISNEMYERKENMKCKKWLVLALCVSFLLGFVACGNDANGGDTYDTPPVSDSESDMESEPEAPQDHAKVDVDPSVLTLFQNGETDFWLIQPEGSTGKVHSVISAFRSSLDAYATKGGLKWYADQKEVGVREILIGRTARPESKQLYEELDALASAGFAIRVVNRNIVIGATSGMMLEMAVAHFTEQFLPQDKEATVQIPLDYAYTYAAREDVPSVVIDRLGKGIRARATELGSIPADPVYTVHQGACTDGTYLYMVLEDQSEGTNVSHNSIIVKLDVRTMEIVMKSGPLAIDHGNDLTYNPGTNELIVSHNAPNRKYLSRVDPDTLTVKETMKDNPYKMYGVTYNKVYNRYVIGISNGFQYCILDENFKPLSSPYTGITGYTKQGMTCDETYIYFLQYKENCITVNDWDGGQVMTIPIDGIDREPEGIFFLGQDIYVTSYEKRGNPPKIWKLTLSTDQ